MNDIAKITDPPPNGPREILSPEGVKERVEQEFTFRITLTGGGKYRVYHVSDGKTQPMHTYDTMARAVKDMAAGMVLHGSMLHDPKRTIERVLKSLKAGSS